MTLGAAPRLNLGPPLVLPEVIPPAPLVVARTAPIALTGFLAVLALRDLLAVTQGVICYPGHWTSGRSGSPAPHRRGKAWQAHKMCAGAQRSSPDLHIEHGVCYAN